MLAIATGRETTARGDLEFNHGCPGLATKRPSVQPDVLILELSEKDKRQVV